MNRPLAIRLSAAALMVAGAWLAYSQNNAKQPPVLTIKPEVKPDLYEIEGDGGNVAVYVTGQGVIMVDDKDAQDYDQINTLVKSVTNQPIRNTSAHHHADHSGGNTRFAASVEIISTVNAHNNIVNKKQSNAPDNMVPARVTFTQESDVFLGGKQVRAIAVGRGHTNGDAVIYFPALRTLHTGDLMAGTTPLIDYPGGGSLAEWPKTLDEAMKLDHRYRDSGTRRGDEQGRADDLSRQYRQGNHARARIDSPGQEPGRSGQGDDRRVRLGGGKLEYAVELAGDDDGAEVDRQDAGFHWFQPKRASPAKISPGKTLSPGRCSTSATIMVAHAMVHARSAVPHRAVRGIDSNNAPRISTTPVK